MDRRDGSPARSTSRAATSSRGSSRPRRIKRAADRPLLRRRQSLGLRRRRRSASSATTNVVSLAGGYTDWKRSGFATELPAHARRREARALQPPPPDPRGRRGGAAEAARLARAAARRGRPRLAGGALPRGGGRRHARDRRRRHASTRRTCSARSCTRPTRLGDAEGRSRRSGRSQTLNPDVEGRDVPASGSRRRTSSGSSPTAGTSSSTAPTTSRRATSSTTRAVLAQIPVVHGSIFRFEGQVTVVQARSGGPCYRCLFPSRRRRELAPICAEAGVLGVLPGIIGSLQATEALKLCLGDRRAARRAPAHCSTRSRRSSARSSCAAIRTCPVCGEHPTITEYVDYDEFCSGRPAHA